jgi:hypothetical protein
MATYSREELRNRVLGRLGHDGVAAPSAEDAELVDDALQQTFEELYDEGLIPFDWESDAIPAPYMIAVSFLTAAPLLTDFGVFGERAASVMAGADRGIRRLRKLKAKPYMGTAQKAVYF